MWTPGATGTRIEFDLGCGSDIVGRELWTKPSPERRAVPIDTRHAESVSAVWLGGQYCRRPVWRSFPSGNTHALDASNFTSRARPTGRTSGASVVPTAPARPRSIGRSARAEPRHEGRRPAPPRGRSPRSGTSALACVRGPVQLGGRAIVSFGLAAARDLGRCCVDGVGDDLAVSLIPVASLDLVRGIQQK